MNYEEARQIGPTGPAPGKWNWSTRNDDRIWTSAPCAWPDFVWPDPPLDKPMSEWPKVTPTGRERCDHDTREEAERHHWHDELGRVQLRKIDLDTARQRGRCDVAGCPNWEDYQTRWPDGYQSDSLCEEHATHQTVVALHPFTPGAQVIHS